MLQVLLAELRLYTNIEGIFVLKSNTLIKQIKLTGLRRDLTPTQVFLYFNQVNIVLISVKRPYFNQVLKTSQSWTPDGAFEDPHLNQVNEV